MNRNTEQHFATMPEVTIGRSTFDRGHTNKLTFNTGDLVPIFIDEILPGDTVKMRMSEVVRMMTPIAPVMDNANMDIYFFFVPNRLVWEHWQEFMGENKTEPWIQETEYQVPQILAPENGWKKGSLADYLGIPTEVGGISVNALPFRGYARIWNDWFRDENLKNPCYISTGDADTQGTDKTTLGNNYDYVVDTEKGAAPCKAAKYHDYFTSALPGAQKGPAVKIPLGEFAPVRMGHIRGEGNVNNDDAEGKWLSATGIPGNTAAFYTEVSDDDGTLLRVSDSTKGNSVVADLTQAVGATVNQLRQAFAVQKFYERQARGGTRYIEMLKSHFGTTNPDFRMQRPEYLGGERVPININQVIQNSESATTPQGTAAGYSVTVNTNKDLFTHSFTEHGFIFGLACVRTVHTYQQGIERFWNRKKMIHYYFPEFANLGEQMIENKEIYAQGTNEDTQAFGYQEAWAEYRYKPDRVCGEMRSNYAQSLDIWHYADDYSELPRLSDEWIDEVDTNVERTLAVQDHDQFFGDFFFGAIYTRPMPLYSIPGLIDHH